MGIQSINKLFLTLGLVLVSSAVFAGGVPETSKGCDPDFMDVMESRAWLEGQREVETAARLILKPDSVLEYSCFSLRVEQLGLAADTDSLFSDNVPAAGGTPTGPLFTNHPASQPRPDIGGPPFTSQPDIPLGAVGPNPPGGPAIHRYLLDNTLGILVTDIEFRYNTDNFGHTYAGGFYTPGGAPSGCNPMQLVWDFSRCSDFQRVDFRTFVELEAADPRVVPTYTALSCSSSSRDTAWTNQLAAAFPAPGAAGAVDTVVTYNTTIAYDSCSANPIETGVTVSEGGSTFPDAVCPNPACYYDGSGSCN